MRKSYLLALVACIAMIGVLGCMAERMKSKLLEEEKLVDMVVGPDAYRDLGQTRQAEEHYQMAITIEHEVGDELAEGGFSVGRTLLERLAGRFPAAIASARAALLLRSTWSSKAKGTG